MKNMKKLVYFLILSFLAIFCPLCQRGFAQSVTIDPSAGGGSNIIQANAQNKALKLPSVAGTSNIGTPQAGQLIYNQSTASPNYYNGTSWQNVNAAPSNIFPNSMYFANPESSSYNGIGASYDTYIWVVPAGVTKIWAQMWGGGGSGEKLQNNLSLQGVGGKSGAYISCLINVTPGVQLNIHVAKGRNQNGNYEAMPSIIAETNFEAETIFELVYFTQESFYKTSAVNVLEYIQSTRGEPEKLSNLGVFSDNSTVLYKTGCEGGSTPYGGLGGKSCTIREITSANGSSTSYSNFYNYSMNFNGNFPGGGGGRGYYNYGIGGNGLIIIHW
jgi:hypothetical protein